MRERYGLEIEDSGPIGDRSRKRARRLILTFIVDKSSTHCAFPLSTAVIKNKLIYIGALKC